MIAHGQINFNDPQVRQSRLPPIPDEEKNKNPFDKGVEEAAVDLIREEEKSRHKMDELIEKSNRVLFRTSTVFPFDFFPSEIIIDENKVSIIKKTFFWSEEVHSIMIKDITDVLIQTIPFFATLIICDDSSGENQINISFLKKDEAIKIRKIIQGLMVSLKGLSSPMLGSIEVTSIPQWELIKKLETLGEVYD